MSLDKSGALKDVIYLKAENKTFQHLVHLASNLEKNSMP
jgi:hypothetical protein